MKTYEIHITGEEKINEYLTKEGIKNIEVELLTPSGEVIRTEYMSSFVENFNFLEDCYERVLNLTNAIKKEGIDIIRIKIETPFYQEYVSKALYIESHFKPFDKQYPISRNKRSGKLMGTDRVYDKSKFADFMLKWANNDVELCICDSYLEEDFDWFKQYS
jgi:hypothetical protein